MVNHTFEKYTGTTRTTPETDRQYRFGSVEPLEYDYSKPIAPRPTLFQHILKAWRTRHES